MIKNALLHSVLFTGFTATEMKDTLIQLLARVKQYKKGETVLAAGDVIDTLCLLLKGQVTIESNDIWGNRSILGNMLPGDVFAEAYALQNLPLLVDATASKDSTILFLNLPLKEPASPDVPLWHIKLLNNLLSVALEKNQALIARNFHTQSKTIRGRVNAYLTSESMKTGKTSFTIPYDRQQLADYLNVDRSALSKELARMREEGLIEFYKNKFTLILP